MEHEKRERQQQQQHPWLLITDGEHNEKQYVYNISENRVHPYLAPELEGSMTVLASAYGWLVLTDTNTFVTFAWNPNTKQKIPLGLLNVSYVYNKCVMSKPPCEPNCHLVFYSTDGSWQAYLGLVGDGFAHIPSYPLDHDRRLLAVAAFRGTIYGLVHPGFRFEIIRFGDNGSVEYLPILKGDQQQPWGMPSLSWEPESWMDYYMIESEEELLLVHAKRVILFVPEELDFRVFRVDVDRKECVELDDIGFRGIFVGSRAGGFCCSSSSSSSSSSGVVLFLPNCIYYTIEKRGDNESRCVFVYDLNKRSNCSLLPCPDTSRTQSQCYWVENQVFAALN